MVFCVFSSRYFPMISSCSQRILSYQKDPKLLMFRRDLELTKTSPVGYADFALLDPFLEDEFPSWFSTQDKCGDDSEDRSLRAKKAFKKLDLNGSGNVRSMAALVTCFVCVWFSVWICMNVISVNWILHVNDISELAWSWLGLPVCFGFVCL